MRVYLPFLVVPMAERGFTPMSSQRREAQSRRSMRLTPASDRTVWRRYLGGETNLQVNLNTATDLQVYLYLVSYSSHTQQKTSILSTF